VCAKPVVYIAALVAGFNLLVAPATYGQVTADRVRLSSVKAAEIIRQHLGEADFVRLAQALEELEMDASDSDDHQAEQAKETSDTGETEKENGTDEDGGDDQQKPAFDRALVRQGQSLFNSSCTECHDAERSTSKRKSYGAWLATVRRMAAKEDADIAANQHVAIATYLTSLNPDASPPNSGSGRSGGGNGSGSRDDSGASAIGALPFSLNGTISPVWRGTDTSVENKGFFVDAWLGIDWRPANSPISGRVTACTTCHGSNQGHGFDLVEASATLDLVHYFTGCTKGQCPGKLEADLKAGRFPVPFGAFTKLVHPGAIRTVSNPLMYNMGRRVGPTGPLQPVLLLPYADEGFNLHLKKQIGCEVSVTFDVYGVNGLQQGGSPVFFLSRSFRDNNSNVAVGGRATIGNSNLRFGGSVASGELQPDGSPLRNYKLSGGDVTFRYEDLLRVFYEYAIRVEDPFPGGETIIYGNVIEAELNLLDCPNINLLARYDTLQHHGSFGDMFTERITSGINYTLRGGSLLIVNHEHWIYDDSSHANIMGVRWSVAF